MSKPVYYEKDDLLKKSLKAIKDHDLTHIVDVVAYLSCSRATFYNHGLDKVDILKDAVDNNKIKIKTIMKKNWFKSENSTLQVALMKLICTDDEAHRLNGSKREVVQEIVDHSTILDELEDD